MRKKIRAAGCLQQASNVISDATSHIWISDQQLAAAFRAFTTSRHRHGSSVPGPLEAMRRASKRKNTSMAWTGSESTSIDPAVVMSTNAQARWWNKAQIPAVQAASRGWHLPFLPFLEPTPPPSPIAEALDSFLSTPRGNKEEFQQMLKECYDFDALRTALTCTEVNLRQSPELCRTIMDHIFESRWASAEVFKVLLEPELNPPGSWNYVQFLSSYKLNELSHEELEKVGKVLARSVDLGLNDIGQIRAILLKLCWIATHSESQTLVQACLSMCLDIFLALEASQVQSQSDLGMKFCERLISNIEKCSFAPAKAQLLQMLSPCSKHKLTFLAAQTNVEWLDYLIESNTHSVQDFVDFLLNSPPQLLPSILIGTSERLVLLAKEEESGPPVGFLDSHERYQYLKRLCLSMQQADPVIIDDIENAALTSPELRPTMLDQSGTRLDTNNVRAMAQIEGTSRYKRNAVFEHNSRPSRLELWFSLLTRVGTMINLDDMLAARSKAWWSHEEGMLITRTQRILLYCWTAVALSQGHSDYSEKLKESGFGAALLKAVQMIPDASTDDVLGRIVISLNDLPLPAKDRLLARLEDFTNGAVVAKGRYSRLNAEIHALTSGDVSILSNGFFVHNMNFNYPQALKEMSEAFNSDLQRFEELARRLIRHSEPAGSIVQRILTHNLEMKLGFSKAWPKSEDDKSDREISDFPEQAVKLVHTLAGEFALSPVLTARQALRRVYFCYLFLLVHHSPILPGLTMALWHAAVTRRNGGTSLTLVKWLVAVIVKNEGPKTAEQLLMNSSFRQIRELKLKDLQQKSTSKPAAEDEEVSDLRNMRGDFQRQIKGSERCQSSSKVLP